MRTVTIDIINDKAIKLLQDLELMQLIRVRREKQDLGKKADWKKYKGAMKRQPLIEIENQLTQLRSAWE
ncbi:MAG: hypothetical protein JNK09_06535 [Prolixibacteraceae bacterium]|nr:hypothetical protein [Prolixibacteraceae bacterium]